MVPSQEAHLVGSLGAKLDHVQVGGWRQIRKVHCQEAGLRGGSCQLCQVAGRRQGDNDRYVCHLPGRKLRTYLEAQPCLSCLVVDISLQRLDQRRIGAARSQQDRQGRFRCRGGGGRGGFCRRGVGCRGRGSL